MNCWLGVEKTRSLLRRSNWRRRLLLLLRDVNRYGLRRSDRDRHPSSMRSSNLENGNRHPLARVGGNRQSTPCVSYFGELSKCVWHTSSSKWFPSRSGNMPLENSTLPKPSCFTGNLPPNDPVGRVVAEFLGAFFRCTNVMHVQNLGKRSCSIIGSLRAGLGFVCSC